MFARVTVFQGAADQRDALVRHVQEQVAPTLKDLRGFQRGYWLRDQQAGDNVMVITVWESQEAMRASEARVTQLRAQAAEKFGAKVQSSETYELIAEVAV